MKKKLAMDPMQFTLDPNSYGLPSREELIDLRIWDSHYHGFLASKDRIKQHQEMMFYVERMGIERIISVDIGGTLQDPLTPMAHDQEQLAILKGNIDTISGIIPIDPGYPQKSCLKMEKWIRNGPCIGIKYVGGNSRGINCEHPNNDQIIRLARELNATVYIHTWFKVGGSPRFPGGGNNSGESSPTDVAGLAKRFPDVPLICGHSGGDWELGIRAVRPYENIFLEFSGSDPHSGAVDNAVNELGASRIVWGGHGPSRSYSTELSKILDASISHAERMKIFGANYRGITEKIFKKKGMSIEV